ncbi:MAG: adenylate/guanylate cyclase domain-containing protein [Alphaproteobacteria bacterium]|nr:adenylate/guanylate cyclase domain-containing protein [Alphaproteobacteria bacterium]
MAEITFEVFAFDGERWTMERNFDAGAEQDAIAHAEELYRSKQIVGVRVIQETIDDATGKATDKTVYKKEKKPITTKGPGSSSSSTSPTIGVQVGGVAAAGAAARAAGGRSGTLGGMPSPGMAVGGASGIAMDAQQVNTPRLLVKAIGAVAGASIATAVLHAMVSAFLTPRGLGGAAVVTSVLAFGLIYVSLNWLLLNPFEIQQVVQLAMGLRRSREIDLGPEHVVAAPAWQPPPRQAGAGVDGTSGAGASESAGEGSGDVREFGVEEHRLHLLQDDAKTLVTFLHDALKGLTEHGKHLAEGKLDAYNTFGCHLFLAGAGESLGLAGRRSKNEMRWSLSHALTSIFGGDRQASHFAEHFDEYLMQPKYLEIYKNGVDAMEKRRGGGASIGSLLADALDRWNDRSEKRGASDYVCVMFTDIVGSTDFTQTHGDVAQYELIKAHNAIVRSALADNAGREIKHTGDGIMAAFNSAYDGVVASIQIQRAVKGHNLQHAELPIGLRIGLNAGEPIKEGADLFGSTVQLAARVCAVAEPGQVVISYVVQGLCAAKNLTFTNLGARQMKGFKDPIEVYRVMWE